MMNDAAVEGRLVIQRAARMMKSKTFGGRRNASKGNRKRPTIEA
jgi:hypothetical protein